jgi:hypothetical protein
VTAGAIGGRGALFVTIETELHGDTHQRSLWGSIGLGDLAVTVHALQSTDLHMTAVRVEDVRGESEELVEEKRLAGLDQLRHPGRLLRLPLLRDVADRARLRSGQARMCALTHSLMTEIAGKLELSRVTKVTELNGLWDRRECTACHDQRRHDDEGQHAEEQDQPVASA